MERNHMAAVGVLLAMSAISLRISSSTYVITAPHELYLGVPTPLSVTVLVNSAVTVTAELQGHGGHLSQAENTFQGGSTGVLLIPPVEVAPGSKRLSFRLTLRGYEGSRLLFTNDTTLTLRQKTLSTRVWTHRSHYRPNQTVKIQVQSVFSDGTPYRGKTDITVQDPTGNAIQQWCSPDSLEGIVTAELTLPHNTPFGPWRIQALVDGHVSGAGFTVYSNGPKGNNSEREEDASERYSIKFSTHPRLLKPSLTFSTQVKIARADQKPLSSADRVNSVRVRVVQVRAQQRGHEAPGARVYSGCPAVVEIATRAVKHTLPEDGKLPIRFRIQEEAERIIVQVSFMSVKRILVLCRTSLSPSGSYSQVHQLSQLAQIGVPTQLHIASMHSVSELHYVVTSRGWLVDAGTGTSSSVSLMPTQSWAPEVCITAFQQLGSGEVLMQTVHLPLHQEEVLDGQAAYETDVPEAEYACNVAVLTDATLQKSEQRGAFKYEVGKAVPEHHRAEKATGMETDFSEPWIWRKRNTSDLKPASLDLASTVSFCLKEAEAFVLFGNHNSAHVSRLKRATNEKPLTWSVHLPPKLVKGEEFILEVILLSHLQYATEVTVAVEDNQMVEFVLTDKAAFSTLHKQKLRLKAHSRAAALFPVRPLVVGEILLSIHLMSSEMQNYTVAKLLVVPEGHQQTFSQSLFLDIPPTKTNLSREMRFTLPGGVVPKTQRAHMAVSGDILAPSIAGLASLIQMPYGCGEQNMIHFAPSVYVLQYLSKASQRNEEITNKALAYMKEGYKQELSYLRKDGSFSGFGQSDPSGSTWLTAFVLRCFLQAQEFMQIDQNVLSRGLAWLAEQQTAEGSFSEPGRVIHTQLQGALDGPVTLTAYVLMALLEDQAQQGLFPGNVSKAKEFLELRLASGISSNYSLSLVAYALSLANSPSAQNAIQELLDRADTSDGVVFWMSEDADLTESGQPSSAGIEMAAYLLLSLFKQGSIVESIGLMKWLSRQRGPSGGFGSTQDTVVALQALSFYAAFSGSEVINLDVTITSKPSQMVTTFRINSTNYLTPHEQPIDLNTSVHIDILMEGRGFAIFQMDIFYNLESTAISQAQRPSSIHEAFELNVEVSDHAADTDHILLSVCTKLLDGQSVEQTGMAMLDIEILSGFTLRQSGVQTSDLVKKVELGPGRVALYLDSLGKAEKCVTIPLVREFRVALVQPALIQVFDYYEPRRRVVRLYHSKVMHELTVCAFCGDSCGQCWAKSTNGGTATIYPRNSAFYSLGCLLLFVVRI